MGAAKEASYRREAAVQADLSHPHIAAVYGVADFAVGGVPALHCVMELGSGGDLAAQVSPGGQLHQDSPTLPLGSPARLARVAHLGAQAALGLLQAHARGYAHCDVKLANMVLSPAGRVLVTDFGIAFRVRQGGRPLAPAGTLEGQRVQLGTFKYMPPENFEDCPGYIGQPPCDVYALAYALLELAQGEMLPEPTLLKATAVLPERGSALAELGIPCNGENLRPRIPDAVDPRLAALIQACWAADPRARPSMAEVARQLLDVHSQAAAEECAARLASSAALQAELQAARSAAALAEEAAARRVAAVEEAAAAQQAAALLAQSQSSAAQHAAALDARLQAARAQQDAALEAQAQGARLAQQAMHAELETLRSAAARNKVALAEKTTSDTMRNLLCADKSGNKLRTELLQTVKSVMFEACNTELMGVATVELCKDMLLWLGNEPTCEDLLAVGEKRYSPHLKLEHLREYWVPFQQMQVDATQLGKGGYSVIRTGTLLTAPGSPVVFKLLSSADEELAQADGIALLQEASVLGELKAAGDIPGASTPRGARAWPVLAAISLTPDLQPILALPRMHADLFHALKDEAEGGAPLSPEAQERRILNVLKTCAWAARNLSMLHSLGVVHGDIKPENILCYRSAGGEFEAATLADFGCAVRTGLPSPPGSAVHCPAAEAPDLLIDLGCGTATQWPPEYFGPVLADERPVSSAAADVYALGVTLVQLASADVKGPFNGIEDKFQPALKALSNPQADENKVLVLQWRDGLLSGEVKPTLPSASTVANAAHLQVLRAVMEGCTHPAPEQRWTAKKAADTLWAACGGAEAEASPYLMGMPRFACTLEQSFARMKHHSAAENMFFLDSSEDSAHSAAFFLEKFLRSEKILVKSKMVAVNSNSLSDVSSLEKELTSALGGVLLITDAHLLKSTTLSILTGTAYDGKVAVILAGQWKQGNSEHPISALDAFLDASKLQHKFSLHVSLHRGLAPWR